MSDIGDVARAVEVVGKIIFEELHPSQQDQIKEAYEKWTLLEEKNSTPRT